MTAWDVKAESYWDFCNTMIVFWTNECFNKLVFLCFYGQWHLPWTAGPVSMRVHSRHIDQIGGKQMRMERVPGIPERGFAVFTWNIILTHLKQAENVGARANEASWTRPAMLSFSSLPQEFKSKLFKKKADKVTINDCGGKPAAVVEIWLKTTHSVLNLRLMEFIQGGNGNVERRLMSFSSSAWGCRCWHI